MAQRDPCIACGRDLSSAFAGDAGARIDRHRGVYQSRKDDIRAHAELGILDRNLEVRNRHVCRRGERLG